MRSHSCPAPRRLRDIVQLDAYEVEEQMKGSLGSADLPGGDWWSDGLVDRLASNQLGMLFATSSQVTWHYALVLLSSNSYGSLMFDLLLDRHNWNLIIRHRWTWHLNDIVNGSVVHSEKYTASLMGHDALKYSRGSSHDTLYNWWLQPLFWSMTDDWVCIWVCLKWLMIIISTKWL